MRRSNMEIGHDDTANVQLLQAIGANNQQKWPLLRTQHVPEGRTKPLRSADDQG